MPYTRVIPRDLFNEANLLKCLGKLVIALEDNYRLEDAHLEDAHLEDFGQAFSIDQNPEDGSIFVENLPFMVKQVQYNLYRPLNSREDWPLYVATGEDDIPVFDNFGGLSPEFKGFLADALPPL